MTLQEAIEHCKDVATIRCIMDDAEQRKCSEEHQQLAQWLTKLADYENVTPISAEWLIENKFSVSRPRGINFLRKVEYVDLGAEILDNGIWQFYIYNRKTSFCQNISLCTRGQVKMFLGIYGMENLIN